MIAERENYLLVERYRPKTLDEYIGNDHLKENLKRYIEEQDIPHILLYGSPGGGKTTAARILVDCIDCDYMFLNASDENNVETVRTKIKSFASSIGFKPLKIVVLDEADFVTPQGQAALRNLMEVFSLSTRFILTANYKERVIEPIISRTQVFEVFPPSKVEIAKHVAGILETEGVEFNVPDVALLVNAYYPDIRHIINATQSHISDGKLNVESKRLAELDYKTAVIATLKNGGTYEGKLTKIRQTIANAKVRDFAGLYRILYDKIEEYAADHIAETIVAIAKGLRNDSLVVDKEINAMACLISVLDINDK